MSDIKIAISAMLGKNAEKDLQTELDRIAKKLKLTIQNVGVANQKLTSSSGSTESATNKATQAMGRYAQGLNNLIHLYKMKEVTDKHFLETMEKIRAKTEFATLSQQKQEQVVNLLAKAEKNYQKVSDAGSTIRKNQIQNMDKAHASALRLNKAFNQQKITKMDNLHKEALAMNEKYNTSREQTLQYEHKIREAIEKQNQTIARRNFNSGNVITGVNASTFDSSDSFSSYIKKQYGNSAEIIGKFNDKALKTGEIVTQANFRVKEGNDKWRMYQATLNKTSGEMRLLDNGLKDVINRQLSWNEATNIAITRILQWGLATSVVYGSFGFLSGSITYINELDNSLNEIRIVTNKTQQEVESLAKSYNSLAKEMSVTTRELAATSADLYRQGLDDGQVEARMRAIVQYAKISSISLEESNKIITSTANATGENVQKIIDIFAFLGDETASGADEIGEALRRVSSAAENSNISLEKSASWIATISSITRESASTIGRSLNSIISRYESIKKTGFNQEDATQINDVTKSLASVGIVALDSQGQLRDFAEVVDELGSKFNTLSKNKKSYITTTLFGTYQRNRGLTLLNNYNYSLENYEKALNSAGVAQEKFNIYKESSQAIIDEFTATVEGLQDKFISSDFLKDTIKAGTEFLNIIDRITTGLGGLNTVLLLLVTGTLVRYTSLLYSIAKGATITQTALVGLSLGVKGLSTALLGLLTNPVTWLITALVAIPAGILLWTNHNQKLLEQQKALTKAQNDFNKTLKEFSNALDSSKIDELKNKLEALKEVSNYEENIEKIKELKKEIEELENIPISRANDGTAINQKRNELIKLEETIKNVIEAEKQYNKQVEISNALDYESQQNIVSIGFR